jgi:hypothetical protein
MSPTGTEKIVAPTVIAVMPTSCTMVDIFPLSKKLGNDYVYLTA